MNKKPVSITLTDKDRQKLDVLAAEQGVNRSEMTRLLIRRRRKQPKPQEPKGNVQIDQTITKEVERDKVELAGFERSIVDCLSGV